MSSLSWNEFRKENKGKKMDEIKELWKEYKEGLDEETDTIEIIEEVISEPIEVAEEVAEVDHRKEFLRLFNEVFVIPEPNQDQKSLHRQLMIHAEKTMVPGYVCGPSDGWTLYLDQTSKALLVNDTRRVAFAITRPYFHKFYQGAALIDEQIFDDSTGIERMKKGFSRSGSLVSRYPIPNHDIKVPRSALDIPLPSGVE